MEKILDKIILLICCGVPMFSGDVDIYAAVPVMAVIVLASLNIAFDIPAVHIVSYILYLLLCYLYSDFIFFIPLMCYDLFFEHYRYVSAALIFLLFDTETELWIFAWPAALLILTYFLKYRTLQLLGTRKDLYLMRDDMSQYSEKLKSVNRELLERQDYEVTNATLNERNRIARELHDTVGHLLSRSILQIGALMAVTKDETQKEYLSQINDTLSSGMDGIRASIHNIHEESMDLESKLNELTDNFTFCEVSFEYKISSDFTMKEKYALVHIVREALNNVMKHSNATRVHILFSELPGFYRIIIEDNGTNIKPADNRQKGMGVSEMCDRVSGIGGNINISTEKGYRIFITLPRAKAPVEAGKKE